MIKEVVKTGRVPPGEPLLVRFLGLSRSDPLPPSATEILSRAGVGETNHQKSPRKDLPLQFVAKKRN